MNNKILISAIVYNLALFSLIGWSIWYLKSPTPLFGLLATVSYSKKLGR